MINIINYRSIDSRLSVSLGGQSPSYNVEQGLWTRKKILTLLDLVIERGEGKPDIDY